MLDHTASDVTVIHLTQHTQSKVCSNPVLIVTETQGGCVKRRTLKVAPLLPPAVVCVRPVGFSHLVQVVFAFNDVALVVESSEELL